MLISDKSRVPACVALVDGDESLCRSLARLLRAYGIESVSYHSAEDFLGDASRPRFDCLVLDVRLVGMSGIELAERLDNSGSQIPVIFISAQDESGVRDRALRAGCAGFLRKSDPAEAVIDALRKLVDIH